LKSEFLMAINQICSERNLPQEVILEAIESALVSAYKRNTSSGQNIKAVIDSKTGEPRVLLERIVAENVEDDRFELSLSEARTIMPEAEVGSLIQTDVTPQSFGRIAAQTAKQVVLQRIREAERDALYTSYADREGELINGMVASITSQAVTLNLGRTEAIMPRSQQVPREKYRIGQRVRAYVMEVRRTSRGPQIMVSRTHRHMLRRLLELEVPEIFNGIVEIKGIAREAGSRSKVAVAALQDGVDPVGSCVGIRGMRIQSIVSELGGEKIDIVEWSPDISSFIAHALSPARVNYAVLNDQGADSKTATVVVPDDQLSLAIGKEGQNARLAAKLTGWRIDIKSQSEAATEQLKPKEQVPALAGKQKDILAMAEAILLGKQPASAAQEPALAEETLPVDGPATLEPVLESELAQPEPGILMEAEALLHQADGQAMAGEAPVSQEPAPGPIAEELAYATGPMIPEALLEREEEPAEEELVAEEVQAEATPALAGEVATQERVAVQPASGAEGPKVAERPAKVERPVRKPRYVYVADEEMEALKATKKKSKATKRQVFLDESTGQLISQRKHKRGDQDTLDSGDEEI